VFHEPNAICRASKDVAGAMHVTGANYEQHGFAVAAADLECHLGFRGEMDSVACHFLQAVLANGVQESRGGAVIEQLRRSLRFASQINFDRMSLVCADAGAVLAEGKSFLITRGYDVIKSFAR
jgi:hypothetical protein